MFFVGIGGVGMSRLAIIMNQLGFEVYGSDAESLSAIKMLSPYGINVVNSDFSLDKSFAYVVYSSAIPPTDVFIQRAKALELNLKSRGEMLAEIAMRYKEVVVCGTHGKTTTTAMIGTILGTEYKTNVYVGGKSLANTFAEDAEYFVIESDESDKTFLLFSPHLLVATNIDADHLNAYDNNMDNLKDAFKTLLSKASIRVVSLDDTNAFTVSLGVAGKTYYFSLNNKNADAFAESVSYEPDGVRFDLRTNRELIRGIKMAVYGPKNLSNAVAAALSCHLLGVPYEKIVKGLEKFAMPSRRLEKKGEVREIVLFDDHADHPTEVEATLNALTIHFPSKRIVAVFQPHRYSRMNLLKENVAKPFYLADIVVVSEIFPAFEAPIEGISGEAVVSWIKKQNPNKAVYFEKETDNIPALIAKIAQPGDIVVLLGPGDVGKISDKILQQLKERL
ncbi:MAG: UDP-N-acetylmuramate--L-alanine ligase [Caldisericaceae bacterium]